MPASIKEHLGSRDIFIVLGDGDYADVSYGLVLDPLATRERDPATAILDEFMVPALVPSNVSEKWRDKLAEKIRVTIRAGGRVLVAGQVLDEDSYRDLAHADDGFNEQIEPRFVGVDGATIYHQIERFFDDYSLTDAGFSIGDDKYYLLKRRRAAEYKASVDFGFGLSAVVERNLERLVNRVV